MTAFDPKTVAAYNESRKIQGEHLCHAPFSNIYFNITGQGAACWLTFHDAPKYPEHSINEIWFGAYYNKLRDNIKAADLSDSCRVCEKNIHRGLYKNALAQAYDIPQALGKYPSIMEFELSNRCNLECVMCNGRLSSSIRKNRDQLPVADSPYDSEFTRQLEEFIPHLKEARFNGGEPFLQEECWEIWERIIAIKPKVEITIATNGTVWSKRVEDILAKGNFRINLSLDGMSPETYETIRKNSRFSTVIANARKFADYCEKKGSIFSVMFNPMRPNWHEMPSFVQYCNENGYHLQFNTIYRPFHLGLWTLPSQEIAKIRAQLNANMPTVIAEKTQSFGNIDKFNNFVNGQLKAWEAEQLEREKIATDYQADQCTRSGAKELITKKLGDKVKSPAKMALLTAKLESLQQHAEKNIAAIDFYHFMNERPVDWLLHDLENRSSSEVIEELFYKAEYY